MSFDLLGCVLGFATGLFIWFHVDKWSTRRKRQQRVDELWAKYDGDK